MRNGGCAHDLNVTGRVVLRVITDKHHGCFTSQSEDESFSPVAMCWNKVFLSLCVGRVYGLVLQERVFRISWHVATLDTNSRVILRVSTIACLQHSVDVV